MRGSTNDWIQTYTSRKFHPLAPAVGDICIEDIAHALSLMCRFNGHTRRFFSVAQHSVIVAEAIAARSTVKDSDISLGDITWGLMHDAAEAYVPDMTRPIKGSCYFRFSPARFVAFSSVEDRILKAVAERFSLTWPMPDIVKVMDTRVLMTEARDLMGPPPGTWGIKAKPLTDIHIEPMVPAEAEDAFINHFQTLFSATKANV